MNADEILASIWLVIVFGFVLYVAWWFILPILALMLTFVSIGIIIKHMV